MNKKFFLVLVLVTAVLVAGSLVMAGKSGAFKGPSGVVEPEQPQLTAKIAQSRTVSTMPHPAAIEKKAAINETTGRPQKGSVSPTPLSGTPVRLGTPGGKDLCNLMGTAAYFITDYIWGLEWYANYQDPEDFGCTAVWPFRVSEIDFQMNFPATWVEAPVSLQGFIFADVGTPSCPEPGAYPADVICSTAVYTYTIPTGGGYFELPIPLTEECCVNDPYFAAVHIVTDLYGLGVDAVTEGTPATCRSYNDYGSGWDALNSWPGPIMLYSKGYTEPQNDCPLLECQWVSFDGSPPLTPTEVEVISCTPSQTVLRIITHGMCMQDSIVGADTFQLITVPEMVSTPEGGRPQLPARGEMIGSSTLAETVMITDISTSAPLTFENLHVFPLQRQTKSEYVPPFVMDSSFYSDSNYFYPPSVAVTGPVGFWHILPISNIGIFPFQYNPVTDSLRVYDTIYVTLSHPGPPVTDTIPRSFTVIYEALTNYKCVFQNVPQDMENFKAHLLIIVPDSLDNDPAIAKLIEYLKKKGFNVTKKKISEAGGTGTPDQVADSLKKTIEGFYNRPECCDKPKYVTLIGDHPQVPGKKSTFGLSEKALKPDKDVFSDEWYELVKGNDYVPDLMLGRIPTSDTATLRKIIDKKIKNDTTAHANVNKVLLVASKEDPRFRETKEQVRKKLEACNFDVDTVYGSSGGTNAKVKEKIEAGVGQVNYVGHGNDTAWTNWAADSSCWTKNEVSNLNVTCKEPIVWAIACDNNKIDTPSVDCIGEEWIKKCKATAHFGSSRKAPAKQSFDLDKFIAEADSEFKSKCETADLGHIIMKAKANLAKSVPMYGPYTLEQEYAILTILEYLLLGDPEQTKWTKAPKQPGVTHPSSVPKGPPKSTFTVSVQVDGAPQEGAIVSLWKKGVSEDEVFQALYTDVLGQATFEINPQTVGVMYVTVWGRNLKVYLGEARVFIRGDCDGDGLINAADVVYLINYLYIHGPAPIPLEAGDVDCDGTINAADVVYLINYLFIGGPPPPER
jgi:hypothetical protein